MTPCKFDKCTHFVEYRYVDGVLYRPLIRPKRIDTLIREDYQAMGITPMVMENPCLMCKHFTPWDLSTDERAREKSPAKRGRKPKQS